MNVNRIILTVCITCYISLFPGALVAQKISPDDLVKCATENNLDLQKLAIEGRQAEMDLRNAKASRLPEVDFQTSLSWLSKPMIEPIKLKAGEFGSYDIGGTSILLPAEDMILYEGMENTHYEFKFLIDQPVYTWGKLRNAVLLYSKVFETSELIQESKRNEIRTGIFVYAHVLYYIFLIENCISEQITDAQRLVDIADESFKNGFLLYTDLLNARIRIKELEIAETELREQKEQAILAISKLSGKKDLDADDLDFSNLKSMEEIIIRQSDYYIDSALKFSPELKMLKELRDISELKIEISRGAANFKPDIGLHLELGYSGPRFPFVEKDWYGQDSLGLTATVALQTKIYEGGKQRIQIERDIEEQQKTYYDYELGLEAISSMINESILRLELNRHNIEYSRLLQENDRQQIEMKNTLFQAGSGSEIDLITEKINLNIHLIDEYKESIDFFRNYFTLKGAAAIAE